MNGNGELPEGFRPGDRVAREQAHTDRTGVTFTLKEGALEGRPLSVMIEEDEPGLPILKDGNAFLMLRFRDEVPFDVAEKFVTNMRDKLESIACTAAT